MQEGGDFDQWEESKGEGGMGWLSSAEKKLEHGVRTVLIDNHDNDINPMHPFQEVSKWSRGVKEPHCWWCLLIPPIQNRHTDPILTIYLIQLRLSCLMFQK